MVHIGLNPTLLIIELFIDEKNDYSSIDNLYHPSSSFHPLI